MLVLVEGYSAAQTRPSPLSRRPHLAVQASGSPGLQVLVQGRLPVQLPLHPWLPRHLRLRQSEAHERLTVAVALAAVLALALAVMQVLQRLLRTLVHTQPCLLS
jgi:hypothetical protein